MGSSTGRSCLAANGQYIPINELSDRHLDNIIRMIERNAKQGIVIGAWDGGDVDEMWYDVEQLNGDEVLDHRDRRMGPHQRDDPRQHRSLAAGYQTTTRITNQYGAKRKPLGGVSDERRTRHILINKSHQLST